MVIEATEDRSELWKELFGSDDEDDDHDLHLVDADPDFESSASVIIEHPIIKGLVIHRQAMSANLQDSILAEIEIEQLFDAASGQNQAMRFGRLPSFLDPLINLGSNLLPHTLRSRNPVFDQLIANYYEPGQGITDHIDLAKFEDGIIIGSFLSSLVMEFYPIEIDSREEFESYVKKDAMEDPERLRKRVDVLLCPGDVICLSGDSRYAWTHGIRERVIDMWEGKEICRGERISLTLRKLRTDVKSD
jgi:hypothetical protein